MWTQLELPQLRSWQLEEWDGQPGWRPPDSRMVAQLWGTILLLRGMAPAGAAPALDLGPATADVGPTLLGYLEQIVSEPTTWEDAAGGHLTGRVEVARSAVEEAMRREAQQAEQQLADAPLDSERVREYAERQRRLYGEGDYLRQRMLVRGAVDSEEDPAAFPGAGLREVLPKRPFTGLEGAAVMIDPRESARVLVEEQLRAAYAALADFAEPVDGEGAEAAVQAIEELRRAGHDPDAVLLPRDVRLQAMLSAHPEWEWTRDFLRERPYRAMLSGVPVYDPGPGEATALVVCDLGDSARRVERRRPGDTSPVCVDVETIGPKRAAQLWDAGMRPTGMLGDRAAEEAALVRGYVESRVEMNVRWCVHERDKPAARRVDLPSQGERRGTRD
jgi:hypothetical protein